LNCRFRPNREAKYTLIPMRMAGVKN
jgi:hypothetical protein